MHWGVFQLWFSFSAGLKSVGSSSPASHFFSQASFAGLLLATDLRPKLVKFEIFSFFHGLELFYCKSLQVRKVTTNTFFDADSNKIVFRLDFFGPSEQFGFEASNSTKIPIVFGHFCFFCWNYSALSKNSGLYTGLIWVQLALLEPVFHGEKYIRSS